MSIYIKRIRCSSVFARILVKFSTDSQHRQALEVESHTKEGDEPPANSCADSVNKNARVPIYPKISKQIKYIEGKCVNAIEVISSPQILKMAYEMIKSNPGNMTKGSDDETLDGISNT